MEQLQVDLDGVADDAAVAEEAQQRRRHVEQARRVLHLRPGDAGQRADLVGDGLAGPDEALPAVQDLPVPKLDRAYLDNLVGIGPQAGGLGVQGNIGASTGHTPF